MSAGPLPFSAILAERTETARLSFNQCWAQLLAADAVRERFIAYMVETFHYVRFTCPLLQRFEERLRPEIPELAGYLAHHREEEQNHDLMLLSDLACLGLSEAAVRASTPRRETIALIGSQLYAIDHAPQRLGHLGYGYALESSPGAPEAADSLAARLDLPAEALSTYRLHCELDPGHVRELEETIDRFVTAPGEQEAVLENMEMTLRFLSELALSCALDPAEEIEAQLSRLAAGGAEPAAQPSA
ncbi:MAG: iron-containing redox enzyme family protein [Alphaproteobacteria bacterium]